jgi:hypothetical protein
MLSDEMLGAYLDSELDPEQRGLVERQLRADPQVASRLRRLRRGDEKLAAAVPLPATDADDPVLAMLVSGERRFVLRGFRERLMQAAALAAACIIGVFGGRVLAPRESSTTPWALNDSIAQVLDQTPSGESVRIEDSEIVVGFTLRSGEGEICRQFDVVSSEITADSLACRDGDGWRLRAQSIEGGGDGFTVAGANSPIDQVIAGMDGAVALDLEAERQLMASGWR